jgi:hypothetical protein
VLSVFLRRELHAENEAPPLCVEDDSFHTGARHFVEVREKRPLVAPGLAVFVQKDAVALLAWTSLQRQGDQIAKPSVRQRVLAGEEAIVGVEPDVGAPDHSLGQQVRPESPRQRRRHGVFEEDPDMATASRARSLERGWHLQLAARLEKCRRVLVPVRLIEVDPQQAARLVL